MNTVQPEFLEIRQAIQSSIEGLEAQQSIARDLLISKVGVVEKEATEYVKEIGANASSALKLLLLVSSCPVQHFEDFMRSFRTVH